MNCLVAEFYHHRKMMRELFFSWFQHVADVYICNRSTSSMSNLFVWCIQSNSINCSQYSHCFFEIDHIYILIITMHTERFWTHFSIFFRIRYHWIIANQHNIINIFFSLDTHFVILLTLLLLHLIELNVLVSLCVWFTNRQLILRST